MEIIAVHLELQTQFGSNIFSLREKKKNKQTVKIICLSFRQIFFFLLVEERKLELAVNITIVKADGSS